MNIKVNGKNVFSGIIENNIVMSNGKITVNGKNIEFEDSKTINVEIIGDIGELSIDSCSTLNLNGNVSGDVKTVSGDVNISGNVDKGVRTTSGDVEIDGSVGGDIETTSGDIKCGDVSGSVRTMSGDIRRR